MATQLKEPEAALDTGQDGVEPQSDAQPQSAEDRAYVRGWRPKEEFSGRGEWVDAAEFLERADQNLGLAKGREQQLNKRISILESMLKKVQRSEMNAHSNALAEIKAKMENAVVTGNVAAFKALDEQADGLRKDMVADTPITSYTEADINHAFEAWADDNEWYHLGGLPSATDTERRQRAYFDRMAAANGDKAQGMPPADFIAYIGELVAEKFPASATPRPKATESVAGVTRTSASRSAKTGANLPVEAKDAVRRYMRQGIYKGTFEESCNAFAKDYDWSPA